MKRSRWAVPGLTARLLLAGALITLVSVCVVSAQAVLTFLPPRTAVVDMGAVFDNYEKARDKKTELETEIQAVVDRLEKMDSGYKTLREELLVLRKGTKTYDEKVLELKKLELEMTRLRNTEFKALQKTMLDFVAKVRAEISKEIRAHAIALDLDLVLEKSVKAEGRGAVVGFEWPVVHYAKPELDITEDVTKRLNELYNGPQGK